MHNFPGLGTCLLYFNTFICFINHWFAVSIASNIATYFKASFLLFMIANNLSHVCSWMHRYGDREWGGRSKTISRAFLHYGLFLFPLRNLSPVEFLGNVISANTSGICLKPSLSAVLFRSVQIELSMY